MANNRIEIIMIRQIIQLKEAGLSNRKISTQLGVHRNSVNTYVSHLKQLDHSFDKLLKLPDKELHVLLDCPEKTIDPRHEILKSLSSHYERELKKVGCTYQTLWYNYRETYPKGYGYTRFKHYLQEWFVRFLLLWRATSIVAESSDLVSSGITVQQARQIIAHTHGMNISTMDMCLLV